MTNTETEAKTKWCPFVRVLTLAHQDGKGSLAPPFNRIALGEKASERDLSPEACRCIASECMAWRWTGVKYEHTETRNQKPHPEKNGWLIADGEPPTPPGNGWEPDGPIVQHPEFTDGVYHRRWKRAVNQRGYCGLAGAP